MSWGLTPEFHGRFWSGARQIVVVAAAVICGCGGEAPPAANSRPELPRSEVQPPHDVSAQRPPQRASAVNDRRPAEKASSAASDTHVRFVDVAKERGLVYTWPDQPHPMTAVEAFGSGCAAFDADNDDWQDILLVGDPHPSLFRNLGGGRFADVTADSGLAGAPGDWTGCAIGDYDGDGFLDVVITGYHQLALYKNLGGMRFQEVTAQAGLDRANEQHWGASAGFMDLDGDNRLDLVILNYVIFGPQTKKYCEYAPGVRSGCGPREYASERGRIWRNTGAGGFEAVPDGQGMADTHGTALVLAFTDLDRDGRMDFYIGNDGLAADFLQNQGQMRFRNVAFGAGISITEQGRTISAMTADFADFDRDGELDLIVTNWQGSSSVLFRGLGGSQFADWSRRTDLAQITKNRMGFGGKWIDFENDGWPDLCIVNGHVYDNVHQILPEVSYRQPMHLLSNRNGRKFVDVASHLGADVQRGMVGRGLATGDFNNDGRIDLVAVDFEGPVMLLENQTEAKSHWLTLDLRGNSPNVFAYGARVTGKSGKKVWLSEVSPASSYLSSSDPRIHWGLGETTQIEALAIRWPSGAEQLIENVTCDQIMRIAEEPTAGR